LNDDQIAMARELGLNPKKFGKLDNHDQESWKMPLPQFIEHIYFKRFKREVPLTPVLSIEQQLKEQKVKVLKKKKQKAGKRAEQAKSGSDSSSEAPLGGWSTFRIGSP